MKRSEVLRREKELMTHYIVAHDRGDEKAKHEVQQEMKRNVEQRKIAK